MNNISTEELCRRFEQRLAAIRLLQAALRDKTLIAKTSVGRETGRYAEIQLATAAAQVHEAIVLLKHSIAEGPGKMSSSDFDRDICEWQKAQDYAASLLGLPLD